jgi:hypothetical protein
VISLRYLYNEHIPMMSGFLFFNPGPELVPDDPPLGALQFTSVEVKSVLQDLVVNKGSSPDGIPLYLLFNRSLATNVFPDRWKVSYVTPIFKKGMRNNVEDYLMVWPYYLQSRSVLNCWFIEECTKT